MGIAYLGVGTGGFLVPLIAAGLEKSFGWHNALTTLGIMVILIAIPLAFFIKDSPVKNEIEVKKSDDVPIKDILKSRNFYLLAFGKLNQSQAAHIMSLDLLMSLAGRVLMGMLADLMKRKYVMILIYLIVGSSIPLLLMPDFPGRIYLFAVIFGIGLGGDYMIIP